MSASLKFVNPGEIDPNSWVMMGWNAKPGKSGPIGFFGTGLKYAIAIVHRLGGRVRIWSGPTCYEFRSVGVDFRGETKTTLEYRKTKGKWIRLAYGTDLGKQWEPWMAFRELYCNALDEGGRCELALTPPMAGTDGWTLIEVSGVSELVEAYEKRSAFMLPKDAKAIHATGDMRVLPGPSNGIYYRGILVGQTDKDHGYTYDILQPVELTEDRTMKYTFMFHHYVAQFWKSSGHLAKDHFEKVATAPPGSFEATLGWDTPGEPHDEVIAAITEFRAKGLPVSPGLAAMHDKYRSQGVDGEEAPMTDSELALLRRAKHDLLSVLGYDVNSVPVRTVRSLGPGRLGLYSRGTITLSKRAFESGYLILLGTLLEEYGHARLSWVDESRDMQNCLINLVATLIDRISERTSDGHLGAAAGVPAARTNFLVPRVPGSRYFP